MRSAKRSAAVFVMAAIAAGLLAGCSSTQRPEGIVERWLVALNQGKAGQPQLYAPDALSERILPGWRRKDPGQLDVIEVGKGILNRTVPFGPTRAIPFCAVPYRVVVLDGPTEIGTAILIERGGDWMVTTTRGKMFGLAVPSQGGPPLGSSSPLLWLGSLGVAVLLTLISIALMSLVGRRPEPLTVHPTGPVQPSETPPAG